MRRRLSQQEVADEDCRQLRRQRDFRAAADAVARALSASEEVSAIALFGSVARPLMRGVPTRYRRSGVELLHESKDVDLAVWVDHCDRLHDLARARNQAVARLTSTSGIGVAHHQVDVFLLSAFDSRYLGRLCIFNECPKGKVACAVAGCGAIKLLRQHEAFVFATDAVDREKSVMLFDRRTGVWTCAVDLPQGHEME